MVKVYIVKLENENIDIKMIEKVNKYKNKEDQLRGTIGELLRNFALMDGFHLPINELHFSYNKFGKPSLTNKKDVHFNISHSGQYVVCAISKKVVGIDIEKIRLINVLKLAKRYFSDYEYQLLVNTKKEKRLNLFFEIWTMKESYLKFSGFGLTQSLNSFTVNYINNLITVQNEKNEDLAYLKKYDFDPHYKLSVCSKTNDFNNDIIYLDINSLITSSIY